MRFLSPHAPVKLEGPRCRSSHLRARTLYEHLHLVWHPSCRRNGCESSGTLSGCWLDITLCVYHVHQMVPIFEFTQNPPKKKQRSRAVLSELRSRSPMSLSNKPSDACDFGDGRWPVLCIRPTLMDRMVSCLLFWFVSVEHRLGQASFNKQLVESCTRSHF